MSAPATVPTEPVTWTAEHISPLDTIPADHRDLYNAGWCSARTASDVLGYRRKRVVDKKTGVVHEEASGAVTRACARYRERMEASPVHGLGDARPKPNELVAKKGTLQNGGFGWLVDTHWLISRVYPQVGAPW